MPLAERLARITALVFDFDGVLTDNRVYVDQDGRETVCCSRADGLALDALRRTKLRMFILSTETNPVVSARGRKIQVPVFQGCSDKITALRQLCAAHDIPLQSVLYVGNDLNDYHAMQLCGVRVCPADSHPRIRDVSDVVLRAAGGTGIVRELAEDVLGLDLLTLLTASGAGSDHAPD